MCVRMRWCAQIYGTTSKVKLRKTFLVSAPQTRRCPSNADCQEISASLFLISRLFLRSPSLYEALRLRLFLSPPPEEKNDIKFIVRTRCDDKGSVSGVGKPCVRRKEGSLVWTCVRVCVLGCVFQRMSEYSFCVFYVNQHTFCLSVCVCVCCMHVRS